MDSTDSSVDLRSLQFLQQEDVPVSNGIVQTDADQSIAYTNGEVVKLLTIKTKCENGVPALGDIYMYIDITIPAVGERSETQFF